MREDKDLSKVLICDDDDVFLSFCERLLIKMGFGVITASNGDEAIKLIKEHKDFELALIDLLMPVRSGWEVIDFLKKNNETQNMPIIAMTGLASSPEDLNQVEEKCSAVIHKGVDFDLNSFFKLVENFTQVRKK